ncbi:MAG: hypothetical protein U5J83_04460 [Bryobacterales bacterium]|nr:hypothetical protein [Bryobacterales bacterium]
MKFSMIYFTSAALAMLFLLSVSCAKQEVPEAEAPPARGERDRVMSELHASRKLLLDATASIGEEKFKSPMGENRPSPSEAVEALIIRERNLLTAMGASTLGPETAEAEPEGLSREERQARAAEAARKIQSAVDGCVAKIGTDGFRVIPNPANLAAADLAQGFRAARDANLAFVRETDYNLRRRTVKDGACGDIDLMTAMMLQSALTTNVAEMVTAAK